MFTEEYLPKISCLMVTANGRIDCAKKSIKCFQEQNYPNKELIIVNEGSKTYQAQLTEYLKSIGLEACCLWLNGKYLLGELRNISIYAASGEIICQWDDDDFNFPTRLSSQFSKMKRSNADFAYLSNQLHYYAHDNTLYWDDWLSIRKDNHLSYTLIPGTLMMYRHLPFRYPESYRVSEDSYLMNEIVKNSSKIVRIQDMGWMHVYSYHKKNVYDFQHHFLISKTRAYNLENILKNRVDIENALNYFKFGKVKVMSKTGVAFEHG